MDKNFERISSINFNPIQEAYERDVSVVTRNVLTRGCFMTGSYGNFDFSKIEDVLFFIAMRGLGNLRGIRCFGPKREMELRNFLLNQGLIDEFDEINWNGFIREDQIIIGDAEIIGLKNSVKASKYAMATDIQKVDSDVTDTVRKLATCEKGSGHDNFLSGIVVQFDLKFTVKAWTEAERYHFFEIVTSQSTMHRITKFDLDDQYISYTDPRMIEIMKELVKNYNDNPTPENYLKVLYSNPVGFKLIARITTNYRQLKTIYSQRRTHRLPEWRWFCEWIETLPHSEFITGGKE